MKQDLPYTILIILSVFSGIIGALIGVVFAFLIAWWNKYIDTRSKLRLLLLANGHDIRSKSDKIPFSEIFGRNRVDIQAAYSDLRSLMLCFGRKRLDDAWHNYLDIRDYDKIPDDEPYKLFGGGVAQSREEAIARIHKFLDFLR